MWQQVPVKYSKFPQRPKSNISLLKSWCCGNWAEMSVTTFSSVSSTSTDTGLRQFKLINSYSSTYLLTSFQWRPGNHRVHMVVCITELCELPLLPLSLLPVGKSTTGEAFLSMYVLAKEVARGEAEGSIGTRRIFQPRVHLVPCCLERPLVVLMPGGIWNLWLCWTIRWSLWNVIGTRWLMVFCEIQKQEVVKKGLGLYKMDVSTVNLDVQSSSSTSSA